MMLTKVRILSDADVAELFDVDQAIASQRTAFRELGLENCQTAPRILAPGEAESVSFCYVARLALGGDAVCKFGSVTPANSARGLPTVTAVVMVLNAETGAPEAFINAATLTTRRTSAASAVAADVLAVAGAWDLAVFGAGVQAEAHVLALARVRELRSVRIWSRHSGSRESLVLRLRRRGFAATVAASAQQAAEGATVVALCTDSLTPVLETEWLSLGATVISIGSFSPERSEVHGSLLERADRIVVDDVDAASTQAGSIVSALRAGTVLRSQLVPLGKIVVGEAVGRASDGEIIFYNSVGLGAQDAAAALSIMAAAASHSAGQLVPL